MIYDNVIYDNGCEDLWVIQENAEELDEALASAFSPEAIAEIGDNNDIVVVTNLRSEITLGTWQIRSKQFGVALYSPSYDVLILLMKGGRATKKQIIEFLNEKNLSYKKLNFDSYNDDREITDDMPELWTARDVSIIQDALRDSLSKGNNRCEIYPNIIGNLQLGGRLNNEDFYYDVDGREFHGLIVVPGDKVISLINQPNNVTLDGNSRNINPSDLMNLCIKLGFDVEVFYDKEPSFGVSR